MGLKTDSTNVAGIEISTTQFAPTRAFRLFARLGKLLAPMLGMAPAGASLDSDLSALAPAATAAFAALDPNEAESLLLECLSGSTARVGDTLVSLNSREKINDVFSGKTLAMLQAAWFSIQVNFADFIDGAQQVASERPKQAPAAE